MRNARLGRIVALMIGAAMGGACQDECPSSSETCEYFCGTGSVAEDSASVSNVHSFDLFFQTVVHYRRTSVTTGASIRAALRRMAVGLELGPEASAASIRAALETRMDAWFEAGLRISHAAPRCERPAQVALAAAAECDASVDPVAERAMCSGICEALPDNACVPSGASLCIGAAPELSCPGECLGACQTPSGEALATGSPCAGQCVGECAWEAEPDSCGERAEAYCRSSESAGSCSGWCLGDLDRLPGAPECVARAVAEASLHAECQAPTLTLAYQPAASLGETPGAPAALADWLWTLEGDLQALLVTVARAQIIQSAGQALAAAARGGVRAAVEAARGGDVTFGTSLGLECALAELPVAASVVDDSTSALDAPIAEAQMILELFDED